MYSLYLLLYVFFFLAEDGIRDGHVTGVQTCALPISPITQRASRFWVGDVDGRREWATWVGRPGGCDGGETTWVGSPQVCCAEGRSWGRRRVVIHRQTPAAILRSTWDASDTRYSGSASA